MPTYEDPIRALRIDLGPGWVFDPFTSSLSEFCFGPWDRVEERLVVNVEPARVSSNQLDELWLARVKDEFVAEAEFVDLPSVSGRAVAATIYSPTGKVLRVAMVRGPRVDFTLEHSGIDPAAVNPWNVLKTAVLSIISAANTNPGEHAGAKAFNGAVAVSDAAVKQGDMRAAMHALRDAICMGTSDWLLALARSDHRMQINIAIEMARVFAGMARLDDRPVPMLRRAEQLMQRVAQSVKKSATKVDPSTSAYASQTLDEITGALHRIIDPGVDPLPRRIAALQHRAFWLVEAAKQAINAKSPDRAGDMEYAAVVSEAARDDLLTLAVQKRLTLQSLPPEQAELAKAQGAQSDRVWAAMLIEALQVQYLCAMDRQDANRSYDASSLLLSVTNYLSQSSSGERAVIAALQATALMQQAGKFLFTGDDALQTAESMLEDAEQLLDGADEQGLSRVQICFNLGSVRLERGKLDEALLLATRGLSTADKAAADKAAPAVPASLRASLHALRARVLLCQKHPEDALADADAAIDGADPLLSTHFMIRAQIKLALKDVDGAVKDIAKSLEVACADNVLGQDVVQILFVASTVTETIDLRASLDLTWAAQSVMDARRLALGSQDDRILFGDAAQQRQLAETLVARLVDADELASALAATELTRARSLNQMLGLPSQNGVAAVPSQLAFTMVRTENVISDLRMAVDTVRKMAAQALEAGGLQPALSAMQIMDLVAATGSAALILQPTGECICLFLILPSDDTPSGDPPFGDARLIVAYSPLKVAEVWAALEQLQSELGISSVARSDDDSPLVDVEEDGAVFKGAIQTLSDALIKPISLGLKGADSLIIVPYRELALIPFSLLELTHGTSLVDRFALSVLPSLSTLRLLQSRQTATPGLRSFVAGDPAADPKNGLIPLPGAAAEATAIYKLLIASGVPDHLITLRTHEQATEDQYRRSARGCRLIHLACHATLRQPAAQSALFLTPGPHDDGQLYPPEIADIGLDNAIVFLSACQTGLGRPTADGVLGLGRAFLEAGARAVIMSMWKVADASTSVLATYFYRSLLGIDKKPVTAARSLQIAMHATRKDLADSKVITSQNEVLDDDPAHWAPFMLLGDGDFLTHA